jgi:ligand-binding sensor domain-containing protein/signal transduction histidine kinase
MTKRVFLLNLILFLFSSHLFGERLPFKLFTTENGLPQNIINRIVRDSNGFLWFCTEDGLSRFDGNLFVNFDTSNGLPHPQVNYILEASDKIFWLATNGGGVVRFDPNPKQINFDKSSVSSFTLFPILDTNNVDANRVNFLYEDKSKRIWVGTSSGLFWLEVESKIFHRVAVLPNDENVSIRGFTENSGGDLWMWSMNGVFRRKPDGSITHFSFRPNGNYDPTRKILFDKNGEIWIAHEQVGLIVLDENKLAAIEKTSLKNNYSIAELKPAIVNWFKKNSGLKDDKVFSIFQSTNGHMWFGTSTGLSEYDGKVFRNYSKNQGFPETISNWITEDVDGNIWATTNQGAVKFAKSGFTTYQQNENVGVRGVRSLWETPEGNLQALTPVGLFHKLEADKFVSLKPKLPKDTNFEFPQNIILDSRNNLWCPTKDGLFRFRNVKTFSDLEKTLPEKIKDLPSNFVNRIFEDSKGNIWIGLANTKQNLFRWNRKTEEIKGFNQTDTLPENFSILAFTEDSFGNIWIGSIGGEIIRYKYENDNFKVFSAVNGVPLGQIQDLFTDSRKQLWVATRGGGIGKITNTDAEIPDFSVITTKDGILSNNVTCIIEDTFGRIYFGTGRGIDWLEPNSGQTGRFTTVDGLNDNKIEISFRDKKGALWFGTANSLAKFVPQPILKDSLHPVFISNLSINGQKQSISEYGQLDVNKFELNQSENQIQIEFSGLDFSTGQNLQFQHKLIGAENDWSLPSQDRKVNFANLAPGDYEFVVKPVVSEEFPKASYATVKFKILSPIYLRWWFLVLSVLFIGLFLQQLYRFRVRRLLEIERTRTRIATDLHDDIGSDLSKISLLSEVVKMQMKSGSDDSNRLLTTIAETSRKSVDSMRDIVWAINPSRDSLNDLVKKMRQFAEETLVEKDIKLIFNAPNQKLKLSMDTRRELYLIFKEAVSNAAKYSNCSQVEIDFELNGKEISLNIKDNGKGFDVSEDFDGNGLKNMKRRCETLKGKFEINSQKDNGTKISAKFPQN